MMTSLPHSLSIKPNNSTPIKSVHSTYIMFFTCKFAIECHIYMLKTYPAVLRKIGSTIYE